MATNTEPLETPGAQQLFARKASGLVQGWNQSDVFWYAFLSCNIIVGFVTLTYATFIPKGSIFWAAILTAAFVTVESLVYAGLITAMPRAGGDYIYQTRIFNSPVGFIVGITAWWFILWQWVPIYGYYTLISFFNPIFRIVGLDGLANFMATKNGVFVSSMIVIVVATGHIALGMKGYAKFQRWCCYIGMVGLAVAGLLLLFHSKADFIGAFNHGASEYYGASGNAYAEILKSGGAGQPSSPFAGTFGATFALLPILIFFMLYPNWGAALIGEVRGARDFRKNFYMMTAAEWTVAGLVIAIALLAWKTMGYRWFMASGIAFWGGTSPINGEYVSPIAATSFLVNNSAFQVVLLAACSLLTIGWFGTLFLSSTRAVFAAAFDRVLPEKAAAVSSGGTPYVALALLSVPAIGFTALYAYTTWYATFTLDASLVIAVSFLCTCLGGVIFPWRLKRIWDGAAIPKWKIGGVPVMSLASAVTSAFLVAMLVYWLRDDVYGVNNPKSLVYMGCLWGAAAVIWVVAAIVRSRQGLPLESTAKQIPLR